MRRVWSREEFAKWHFVLEIWDETLFFFSSCHFQTLSSLYLIYTDSYNPTLFLHRKSCNSRPLSSPFSNPCSSRFVLLSLTDVY